MTSQSPHRPELAHALLDVCSSLADEVHQGAGGRVVSAQGGAASGQDGHELHSDSSKSGISMRWQQFWL